MLQCEISQQAIPYSGVRGWEKGVERQGKKG